MADINDLVENGMFESIENEVNEKKLTNNEVTTKGIEISANDNETLGNNVNLETQNTSVGNGGVFGVIGTNVVGMDNVETLDVNSENVTEGVFGGVTMETTQINDMGVTVESINNVESGVYGGVATQNSQMTEEYEQKDAGTIRNTALPVKFGFWQKFKKFWFEEINWNAEIKIELTPKQQKIKQEVYDFWHQEITWEKVQNFLFKEVKFGKKNKNL